MYIFIRLFTTHHTLIGTAPLLLAALQDGIPRSAFSASEEITFLQKNILLLPPWKRPGPWVFNLLQ